GALEVIGNGVRPLEPGSGDALLVTKPAVSAAQRNVVLGGHLPPNQALDHPRLPFFSHPRLGLLLALDALEQSSKVTGAKPLIALAGDQRIEEGSRAGIAVEAGRFLEEDLQQIAVLGRTIDEDAELAQDTDVFIDGSDPRVGD